MLELKLKIVLDRADDSLPSRLRSLLNELPVVTDHKIDFSRVADHPAIICLLYLHEERLQGPVGREVLSLLSYIRSVIESTGTRALQIIIDDYDPPSNLLIERNGLWTSPSRAQGGDLSRWLVELGARELNEWLFLPFSPQVSSDDSAYELWGPDEKLEAFGRRINDSSRRVGAPISLKIRMQEGRRLSEYVSTAFGPSLDSFSNLGGENVLLTTLLQMNDRLDMVNHYSERLERPEVLNLFSLSAMNLSLADVADETNIAVLTSSGKLILEDIKMGG